MHNENKIDPAGWVDNHGDSLYRYAYSRIRDQSLAEDIVQETFLNAWRSKDTYKGMVVERNWLFAICKNKIIDHFRSVKRAAQLKVEEVDIYFDKKEHWTFESSPREWHSEHIADAESGEFYHILDQCQNKLKEVQKSVFVLKYLEDMDAKEICEKLDISISNFWVLIHRSKLQLRACLEKNWFKL